MAGVLVSNALIFPAITLYLGNVDSFAMALFPALKLVLLASAFLFLLAFVVLGLLDPPRQRSAGLIFGGLSLLVWVQSSFLIWDYGVLDGRPINWSDHQFDSLVDIGVWLCLMIVMVRLAQKRDSIIIQAATVIFSLQCVVAAYNLVDVSPQFFAKNTPKNSGNLQKILGFSPEKNVLHILVDGFQADVFEDLITTPELQDEYNKHFDGFVYYRETLGIFPYTRFAVPAFLSGKVYSNQQVKNTFIDDALRGETIISMGRDNGFDIDLIVDGSDLFDHYAHLPYDNIQKISDLPGLRNPLAEPAMLLDLALFRITPGAFKVFVYQNQKWLASQVFSLGDAFHFYYFKHTYFLDLFSEKMHANRDAPVYKYLHVMNTHNPMVVNEDCSFTGQPQPSSRYRLTLQARCTLHTLEGLLDKMKALGIYDQATIIIHGDHGGWVGTHRSGPDILFADDWPAPFWVKSLASPLLAIKLPGATGPIRTSNVLASLLDIPDTLRDIMNWSGDFGHTSLLALRENESRTRYFRYYDYQRNAWEEEHTPTMREFAITGSHYETEWVLHRLLPPPDTQ